MVDIQTVSHFSMEDSFIQNCLSHKILAENKLLYVLPPKYDMLIRASDLVGKPHKDWHRRYIFAYSDEFDEQLVDCAFSKNPDYLNRVKQIVSDIREKL